MVHVGGRVERAAEPFERERLIVRRGERLRPAEDHVLEEMRDAVVFAGLEARPDTQEERRHRAIRPW